MITLYSYPELFGLADNNPYGLKIFAFLKLCELPFRHAHIIDTAQAPRGQLPYLTDDDEVIGDSDTIIAHLIRRHHLTIDAALTEGQRDTHLLIRRTLDDLYWVMSYSRWKDDRFWPLFRDAMLQTHPDLTEAMLLQARAYNFDRYKFQGIGRFEPEAAYARGLADLQALAHLLPAQGFMFGALPGSIDAGLYGFIANIVFYEIPTPLKAFVMAQANLVAHCHAIHAAVMSVKGG
jgi:glutathione S-transferase